MPTLLLVDGIANSETLATLGAATAEDCAAPTIFHTLTETMLVYALTIVRLECSLHNYTFKVKLLILSAKIVKSLELSRGYTLLHPF